jgi:hypothetical protein
MLDGAASSFIFKNEPVRIIETIDEKHGQGSVTERESRPPGPYDAIGSRALK